MSATTELTKAGRVFYVLASDRHKEKYMCRCWQVCVDFLSFISSEYLMIHSSRKFSEETMLPSRSMRVAAAAHQSGISCHENKLLILDHIIFFYCGVARVLKVLN